MKASMPRPRPWTARRSETEPLCCTGRCLQAHACPLYDRSETLPIPLGVPTGEHRPASLLMRVLRWFK